MRTLQIQRLLFPWMARLETDNNETSPLVPKGDIAHVDYPEGSDRKTERCPSQRNDALEGSWHEKRPFSLSNCLLKHLLFASNLFFTVLSFVTLALGLWGMADKESFSLEKIDYIGTDPMLAFASLGLVLFLLCLSGCVGTLRENCLLLQIFSAGVLVLVAAQVLTAIVAFAFQGQVEGYLRTGMLSAVVRYRDDLDLMFIIDEIQTGLQCCGADNYRDWEVNIYFNCSAPGVQACGVPPSCCVDPLENGTVWNSQCGVGARLLDEFSAQRVVFLGGCLGGVSRWVELHAGAIGMVCIMLLGIQVLTAYASTRLLEDIQRSKFLQPMANN